MITNTKPVILFILSFILVISGCDSKQEIGPANTPTTPTTPTTPAATTLPNTGAGDVLGIFAASSAAAGAGHFVVSRRRARS